MIPAVATSFKIVINSLTNLCRCSTTTYNRHTLNHKFQEREINYNSHLRPIRGWRILGSQEIRRNNPKHVTVHSRSIGSSCRASYHLFPDDHKQGWGIKTVSLVLSLPFSDRSWLLVARTINRANIKARKLDCTMELHFLGAVGRGKLRG